MFDKIINYILQIEEVPKEPVCEIKESKLEELRELTKKLNGTRE